MKADYQSKKSKKSEYICKISKLEPDSGSMGGTGVPPPPTTRQASTQMDKFYLYFKLILKDQI